MIKKTTVFWISATIISLTSFVYAQGIEFRRHSYVQESILRELQIL